MRKIAVIPARSGSKGLADKNIAPLCGKPLMAYSIEAARDSGIFERVLVSTDSEKYAAIAREYGAGVCMRPAHLADDTATTYDVLADLFAADTYGADYFVLLQPTSPLRTAEHIRQAAALFESRFDEADSLVSVTEAPFPPSLVKPIGADLSLRCFDEDFAHYRRQNQRYYSPNGAIYMAKFAPYLAKKHFYGERGVAYIMDAADSVDIDDEVDIKLAALRMQERL